ncbi:hypothetical protein FOA52_004584 [Chlamydomonas sp. UWO 241]|nr:hypothetical protein FOA52_004584 [Chlamydomonas sp. UWO 241]
MTIHAVGGVDAKPALSRASVGPTPPLEQTDGSGASTSEKQNLREAFLSELLYCTVGAGTILFNKHALSTFHFPAPNTLLLFQFSLAVLLLKVLALTGAIHLEPIRWSAVKLWMPLNLVFVAMNVTGFLALQSIGAGMFTVLKNLSNLLTIGGDWYLYQLRYSWQVRVPDVQKSGSDCWRLVQVPAALLVAGVCAPS